MVLATREAGVVDDHDPAPVPYYGFDMDHYGELKWGIFWKPMRVHVRFPDGRVEPFEWNQLMAYYGTA